MYKLVFKNSKAALVFAGMTVFSATSMVGTPEESGVVGKAVEIAEARRDSFGGSAQGFAGSGNGQEPAATPSEAALFGEYEPANSGAAGNGGAAGNVGNAGKLAAVPPAASARPAGGYNPMTAPLAPTAVASSADEGLIDE